MARREKLLPARRPRAVSHEDDSILLRSAESIGRVIGILQRELDDARSRVASLTGRGNGTSASVRERPNAKTANAKAVGARKADRRSAAVKPAKSSRTRKARKASTKSR